MKRALEIEIDQSKAAYRNFVTHCLIIFFSCRLDKHEA